MRARAIRKNSLIACIFHHFATRHKCNKHSREPDVVDDVKYWVKSVGFKVPFKKGTPGEYDTLELNRTFQPNEVHVETVVKLSQKHIDHSIRVELDLDEFEETPSELRKKSHLQGD